MRTYDTMAIEGIFVKEVLAVSVESSLPAYTTVENIIQLIDALRRRNNDEEEAKPLFGKGGSAFRNTKSALRTFSIIKESNTDFTDEGRQIAYADSDEKRKSTMLKVIWNYPPYESLLLNIIAKKEAETETNSIIGFWGRFGYGSTERNRKEGANLFGNMMDYIGLGTFVKGRGKYPTRIIWESGFDSKIPDANQVDREPENGLSGDSLMQDNIEEDETNIGIQKRRKDVDYSNQCRHIDTAKSPSIVIKVDMTSWSEEKMKNFFKLAYGNFGDE